MPVRRFFQFLAIGLVGVASLVQTPAAAQGPCVPPVVVLGVTGAELGILSADGRYVAFTSEYDDEVPGDTNGAADTFVYDRLTCSIELVSANPVVPTPNPSGAWGSSISTDGRYVAFNTSDQLVAADTIANSMDVYVRDRTLGTLRYVPLLPGDDRNVGWLSGDGSTVLVMRRWPCCSINADLYTIDLATNAIDPIVDAALGIGASISDAGRVVAFLDTDPSSQINQVYVHDRQTGVTTPASVSSQGTLGNGHTGQFSISGDGRYVSFLSIATNLVPGDTVANQDIFVRDLQQGLTTRVSVVNHGGESSENAFQPAISANGRYVAFVSYDDNLVAGDTNGASDVFVHDRQTTITRRVSTTADGIEEPSSGSPGQNPFNVVELSGDGQIVSFSAFGTLFDPDPDSRHVIVTEWLRVSAPPNVNLVMNGNFAAGSDKWAQFALPDLSHIVSQTSSGAMEYYRVPPPPGVSGQAVVFQELGVSLHAGSPVVAQFQLGNSSSARKRISVLILDGNFSDLHVCTFWLPPNLPLTLYQMRTHTTRAWTNAAVYFYAATAGSDGGFYRVDNVSLEYQPGGIDDRTACVDPLAPAPAGGAAGPNLLLNGDFATGTLAPWGVFGTIGHQIAGGVFEFIRPTATPPAGVVLQATGQAINANDILTATFQLGNSSTVRKRVTVILHDNTFGDLSACTFWLAPGQSLADYTMQTYATQSLANLTLSVYAATVGPDQWIRLDNVTLRRTPSTPVQGTECLEPATPPSPAARPTSAMHGIGLARPSAADRVDAPGSRVRQINGGESRTLDGPARFRFDSLMPAGRGLVQVSVDGQAWTTIAIVPSAPDWTTVEIDLGAGQSAPALMRFRLDSPDGMDPTATWVVRNFRVAPHDVRRVTARPRIR